MRVENTLKHILPVAAEENVLDYPPCTIEEDTFALAIVESGGNVRSAYAMTFGGDEPFPIAKGNMLLMKPQVAFRVRDLVHTVKDSELISLASHLGELADIRDLAKSSGQLKTALAAEISRGNAVGIYKTNEQTNAAPQVAIQINMASPHDVNI
jgi:hypothetical protein